MQKTVAGSPRLVIIHTDVADAGLNEAIVAFQSLSESGHVGSFFLMQSDVDNQANHQVGATLLSDGQRTPVDFLDEVARVGKLSAVDVFSGCSSLLSSDAQSRLSESARTLKQRLTLVAPKGVSVDDHRVFLPEFGEVQTIDRFFDGYATFNLMVLPEDREFDGAFANPIETSDDQTFGWHAAVEIASIAGLWTTMEGSPCELCTRDAPGVDDISVRVVRSFVRAAVSVHPSLSELMGSSEALPVPQGLETAPDPFDTVKNVAGLAHPPAFRLPQLEPFDPLQQVNGWSLIRQIAKRVITDVKELPRVLERGLKGDLDEMVEATSQALIGEDSWVRSVGPGSSASGSQPPTLDVKSVVADIEAMKPPPSLNLYKKEDWNYVVTSVLGVMDGSPIAAGIREEASTNSDFIVVDRAALIPATNDDLAGSVQSLGGKEEIPELDPENVRPLTLLGLVTRCFRNEERRADERLEGLLSQLQGLSTPEAKERAGATHTIRVCIWASVIFAFIALTTLIPDTWLTFGVNADARMILFVWASVLLFIPVGLLFAPDDRTSVYVFSLLVGLFTLATVLTVFVGNLREQITSHSVLRWLAALLVIGAVMVFAISGTWLTRDVTKGWRLVARRAVFYLGLVYGIVMAIIGLNRPEFRPAWLDARESQIVILILIVATVAYVVGAVIVSVAGIQDEFRHDEWSSEFRWLKEEAEESVRNCRLVSGLYVHWLGTAVVMLRLIRRPYGEEPRETDLVAKPPIGSEAVRKIQVAALNLTPSGRMDFLARAGPKLSPPGWLTGQYRKICKAFLDQEAVVLGKKGDGGALPEHCTYPVELDDAINGIARGGMRWPFAYNVYSGKFDAALRELAEAELEEPLLETFINVPGSWVAEEESSAAEGLGAVFQRLLPPSDVDLPTGALGLTVAARLGPRDMESYVWWPENVQVPGDSSSPTATTRPKGVGSSLLFQAVRVDISEPLWGSQFGGESNGPLGGSSDFQPEGERDSTEMVNGPLF